MRCPCGSGESYPECCGRFHSGAGVPATARALMASRFAAFAVGDSAYLLRTWHASTRPRRVDLDPAQRWLRLDIVSTSAGGPFDVTGEVEFRAFYRGGSLHERSRFVREGGEWFYVRGDVQET